MAVRIYKEGEHPAGFVGVRVSLGQYKSVYFNFKAQPGSQSKKLLPIKERKELIDKAKALDAQYKEEKVVAKSKATLMDHWHTKPCRAAGMRGITLAFNLKISRHRDRRNEKQDAPIEYDYADAGFRVTKKNGGKGQKIFYIKHGYAEQWEQAVRFWAVEFGMGDDDRRAALSSMPDPARFVELYFQLKREGRILPKETLKRLKEHTTTKGK